VKETVMKGLEYARWKLLEKSPFIGEMLLRFSIVPTYDCRCNTAATDGSKIFFDCEFYSKLNEKQREFVLAHEVWHNIFLHFRRRQTREPMMWNIATDMEINHMLQNEGMEVLADACLPDPIVAGKNAEDIYAHLMKQQQKQQKQNGKGKGQGQGNGSGNSNGDGEGDGDSDGDSQSSSSGGSSGNGKKSSSSSSNNGNNKGKHGNQFDRHIYEGETAGDGEKQEGKWGEKGFDEDFNPSMKDAKETEDKIKEMVTSVAQSIERKQGHLPAGVASLVEKMLKPEINWKEALSQFVTKTLGGEHSWSRCSRHALARGHYLPGKTDMKIKAALVLDTSGSYLQDLPKFLAEFKALVESFGKYEITLVQCDAEVQDVK
jgi:predicted metal-dependent peptidase